MHYQNLATSETPALIIFLLDASGSMRSPLRDGQIKADVAWQALQESLNRLVALSRIGEGRYSPRFRVAMYLYEVAARDVLGGVHSISERIAQEAPSIEPDNLRTNTRQAFEAALRLLKKEIPSIGEHHPAPLVCHLTDGQYNEGGDPRDIVREIMDMEVPDGNVLVSNIFFSDIVSRKPASDISAWTGITNKSDILVISDEKTQEVLQEDQTPLNFGEVLFEMSSVIPESYREVIAGDIGVELDRDARMLFPGESVDMVRLGFVMSTVTGSLPQAPRTE